MAEKGRVMISRCNAPSRPTPAPRLSLAFVMFTWVIAIAPAARADSGVLVGARAGIQLLDDHALRDKGAPSVGAEVRLSFELSPLIVSVTFDNFFVRDRTLFQLGANVLYDLPIGASFLYPYVGIGVGVTRFEVPETNGPVMAMSTQASPGMAPATDSNGMRIGLNLIGGVRFQHVDLPVVRPFVQVMGSVGPIELFTILGGVLFELSGG